MTGPYLIVRHTSDTSCRLNAALFFAVRKVAGLFAVCAPLLTASTVAGAGDETGTIASPPAASSVPSPGQQKKLSALWVPFVANQGQLDPQVKFYARTFGGTSFVTAEGKLVHSFAEALPEVKETSRSAKCATHSSEKKASRGWSLVEELVNAKRSGRIEGEEASESHVSSFIGTTRANGKLTFRRLVQSAWEKSIRILTIGLGPTATTSRNSSKYTREANPRIFRSGSKAPDRSG